MTGMDVNETLLTRGVEQIIPAGEDLKKILRERKKLRVYMGFDPTAVDLHIGHLTGLRKLRQWQEAGHEVIFLIGDFTARIGDPTGRSETRPMLSRQEVGENAKNYRAQAAKILRFDGKNPAKIEFNSRWLDKMALEEFLRIAALITHQQIIERDLYQVRIRKNKEISLNEILYPILQGYDSCALETDVEIGGRDQLFNMMMGRTLVSKMKRKNKFVMSLPLLVDKEGAKIGKTRGNAITLSDSPAKIFGAIMSFSDSVIASGLECLTDIDMEEIKKIKSGENPLRFKKILAFEVVKQLYDQKTAETAEHEFENVFQKGQFPSEVQTIKVDSPQVNLADFLAKNNLIASKSQAKRLIDEGAIEIDGQTVNNQEVEFKNGQIVKIGKKKFVKINC